MFLMRQVSGAALALSLVLAVAAPAPAQFRQARPAPGLALGNPTGAAIFNQAALATQANLRLANAITIPRFLQNNSPFPVYQMPGLPVYPSGIGGVGVLNNVPMMGYPGYPSYLNSAGYPGYGGYPNYGSTGYGGGGYGSEMYVTNPYPYSDYFKGVAAMTNANGQYLVQVQQARLLREQADQASLQNRRLQQEQSERERGGQPDQLQTRPQTGPAARTDAPASDIRTGDALNAVLGDIQRKERASGKPGPNVPVDPTVVSHVNVRTPASRDTISAFKDGGRLNWPLALTDAMFKADREKLDTLGPDLAQQTAAGKLDPQTTEAAQKAIDGLRAKIKASVDKMSPSDYVRASRYADELYGSLRALGQPEAQKQLNGEAKLQGNTVGDLVAQMTKNGLLFGPASSGEESDYRSLLQALQTYNDGLSRVASR